MMIDPAILLQAYSIGVFPMADDRDAAEVYWVEPKQRAILPLDGFHLSKSLAKKIRRDQFRVTANRAFADILALRTGRAADRVARLLSIMSFGVVGRRTLAGQVLPRLRDIAEITGLTIETVSRTIKQLRGEGLPGLTGGQSTAEKEEDASGR